MAPRTAPSAELEEAALMPKVVAGLTQYVAEKKHSDRDHPAFTPNFIAPWRGKYQKTRFGVRFLRWHATSTGFANAVALAPKSLGG